MTLDPPRWKDGPEICPAVNLPHFFLQEDFEAFERKLAPESGLQGVLVECSQCDFLKPAAMKHEDCGGYHFLTGAHADQYLKINPQKP